MNTSSIVVLTNTFWVRLVVSLAVLTNVAISKGQGTVTFDQWPAYAYSQTYTESGVLLQVLSSNGNAAQSYMARMPGGVDTADPTPFMDFVQDHGTNSGNVAFRLQSGQAFGVTSVDIGGIVSTPTVVFRGHLAGGGIVSATYYIPQYTVMETFSLGPDFAQGLSEVDIISVGYALDNLIVTVPEPGSVSLVGLGLIGLAVRATRKRQKAPASVPKARAGQ